MPDKDCPVPEPFSGAKGSILFLSLLFLLTFISRFIFAPLMTALSRELGLSPIQSGAIFLTGSVGAFVGSLPADFSLCFWDTWGRPQHLAPVSSWRGV